MFPGRRHKIGVNVGPCELSLSRGRFGRAGNWFSRRVSRNGLVPVVASDLGLGWLGPSISGGIRNGLGPSISGGIRNGLGLGLDHGARNGLRLGLEHGARNGLRLSLGWSIRHWSVLNRLSFRLSLDVRNGLRLGLDRDVRRRRFLLTADRPGFRKPVRPFVVIVFW